MTQREEFEGWAESNCYILDLDEDGDYENNLTFSAFEAYQAAKAQAVPQWVPVSERLPDAGVFCIILDVNGVVVNNQFEYYKQRHIKGYFDSVVDGCVFELTEVTHWMPLPSAPEKNK